MTDSVEPSTVVIGVFAVNTNPVNPLDDVVLISAVMERMIEIKKKNTNSMVIESIY